MKLGIKEPQQIKRNDPRISRLGQERGV